jgi:hypothetical protein
MNNTHILRVKCNQSEIKNVEATLNKPSTDLDRLFWKWSISDDVTPAEAFNNFLNLLIEKYDALEKIAIDRSKISIWRHYEYDQECSLEISPEEMRKMGAQGIVLCISCWQSR